MSDCGCDSDHVEDFGSGCDCGSDHVGGCESGCGVGLELLVRLATHQHTSEGLENGVLSDAHGIHVQNGLSLHTRSNAHHVENLHCSGHCPSPIQSCTY